MNSHQKSIFLHLVIFPLIEFNQNGRNSKGSIFKRNICSAVTQPLFTSRMIRNAREENSRRGGWVRVFPTAETWSTYGSMLEFSSPNNQILHEHLFPETTKRHQLRPPNYRKNATKNPVKAPLTSNNIQSGNASSGTSQNTEYRKRSQSAGPGREKLHETETESANNKNNVGNANNASKHSSNSEDSGDPESLPTSDTVPMNRPRTSSGAVVMSSQNSSSSSSSSSGIGSMTSSEDDITCDVPSSPPNTTCK